MKHTAILSIAALALGATAANAADAYSPNSLKDAPAPYAPAAWTGFYFGVNGGYGQGASSRNAVGSADLKYTDLSGTIYTYDASAPLAGADPTGGLYGIQSEYLFQSGAFVFGLGASFDGSSIEGTKHSTPSGASTEVYSSTFGGTTYTDTYNNSSTVAVTTHQQLDYLADLTAKVGLTLGNGLVYLKAGGAIGQIQNSVLLGDTALSNTSTETGWTAGGGVAYKLTPSWTAFAEYDYYAFGDKSLADTGKYPVGYTYTSTDTSNTTTQKTTPINYATTKISQDFNVVKAGINYQVGGAYVPLK